MQNAKTFTFWLVALLLCLPALQTEARTIDWGSEVGSTLFDSTGAPLDDNFVFELGSFGSFIPTESNMTDWLTYWKPFDRATAPATSGWNSTDSYFTSSSTLLEDGTSSEAPGLSLPGYTFAQGEQAYIWVYNRLTLTTAPDQYSTTTEWALFTNGADGNAADDWLFPAHTDQTSLPLDWTLADATRTPFGGTNNVEGPGNYSVNPGTFDLQTHVVPEPGSLLLLAASACLIGLRRRKTA